MEPHYTWPRGVGGKEGKAGSVPGTQGRRKSVVLGRGGDRRIALHVDMSVSVEVVHKGRRKMQPWTRGTEWRLGTQGPNEKSWAPGSNQRREP